MMKWQELVPLKIAIKYPSDKKVFHYFSFGEIMNGRLFKYSNNVQYRVEVHTLSNPENLIRNPIGKFSNTYSIGTDWIYYERKYGNLRCKLFISGVEKDHIKIYSNQFYANYIKARIDNIWPIGIHTTDLLLLKILKAGDLVIHGASLSTPNQNTTFLIIAPPSTGKTYTAFKLLEKGYKFLGEDLSYYNSASDSIICMPYTSTWGHRYKLRRFDLSTIPFFGLFSNQNKKSVEEIFGENSVIQSARLDRIYLLEKTKSATGVQHIKVTKDIIRKVIAVQRSEFSYYKNPLLRAYEYYHPIGIDDAFNLEAKNLVALLKSKEVYIIKASDYKEYVSLLKRHVEKN
jgi:hypothetical protein